PRAHPHHGPGPRLPPHGREIGEAVGLTSSSSVHSQLTNLERRGLLRKDPTKPRPIGLPGPGADPAPRVQGPLPGRLPAAAAGPAEDEATVKRLRRRGSHVMLEPANPSMESFELEGGRIAGKVVAVLRRL